MSTNESVACEDVVYKGIWEATVGELQCVRERGNEKDKNSVAVMMNNTVSGHLPRR